jgi:hypothetical protein
VPYLLLGNGNWPAWRLCVVVNRRLEDVWFKKAKDLNSLAIEFVEQKCSFLVIGKR